MGVNHGRANVLVAQQFLHGANIITVGLQVRGGRMPKKMPVQEEVYVSAKLADARNLSSSVSGPILSA